MSTSFVILGLIVLVQLLQLLDDLIIERLLLLPTVTTVTTTLPDLVPASAALHACEPVLPLVSVALLLLDIVGFPLKQEGVFTQDLFAIFEAFGSVGQLRIA